MMTPFQSSLLLHLVQICVIYAPHHCLIQNSSAYNIIMQLNSLGDVYRYPGEKHYHDPIILLKIWGGWGHKQNAHRFFVGVGNLGKRTDSSVLLSLMYVI